MVAEINMILAYLTQVEIERLKLSNIDQKELDNDIKLLQKIFIVFSEKHD